MFKAKCPLCNGIYKAKPEWIRKKAPCPHCHQKIVTSKTTRQGPHHCHAYSECGGW